MGEHRTAVKEWLAACLWYLLYYTLHFRGHYSEQIERAASVGISLRAWFDSVGRDCAD
jgi:hypothetical protein